MRLAVETCARTLLAHDERGYEEWGASAALRFAPKPTGRGLSLSLAPVRGNAASASERLWGARDASALSFEDTEFDAEVAYGLDLRHGRGLLTPYAGAMESDDGART